MTAAEIGIAFLLLALVVGGCTGSDHHSAMQFDLGLVSITVCPGSQLPAQEANHWLRFMGRAD